MEYKNNNKTWHNYSAKINLHLHDELLGNQPDVTFYLNARITTLTIYQGTVFLFFLQE